MKRMDLWVTLVVLCSGLFALSLPAAAVTYAEATKVGRAHGPGCVGGFPDTKGECWVCPAGYRHDNILLPPTHDKVCKKEGGADRRKGDRVGKSVVGVCKAGWLSTHDGGCYTCPAWNECMRLENIAMGAKTHEVDIITILDELNSIISREG